MRNQNHRLGVSLVELIVVLAVIAATVSGVLVKKGAAPAAKAKRALIGTLVTLALVAAVIPWHRLVATWT
jgi:prepilin-type N-terminal cleavage/methylation domain-containing protein